MDAEIRSILDRAEELFDDLEKEYKECLENQKVTERAKNLTHEVLERLRVALEHTMRRLWEKTVHHIFPRFKRKKPEFTFQSLTI